MIKRFCFAHDDDGHSYLIPLTLREKFNKDMEHAYSTDDFGCVDWVDEYRCGNETGYSFLSPELIRKPGEGGE